MVMENPNYKNLRLASTDMVMEKLNYKNLKTDLQRYGHGEPQLQELKD